ncbi:hypothetical protein BJ875DRAFT_528548, partial [Amylocarpus encephaloides]
HDICGVDSQEDKTNSARSRLLLQIAFSKRELPAPSTYLLPQSNETFLEKHIEALALRSPHCSFSTSISCIGPLPINGSRWLLSSQRSLLPELLPATELLGQPLPSAGIRFVGSHPVHWLDSHGIASSKVQPRPPHPQGLLFIFIIIIITTHPPPQSHPPAQPSPSSSILPLPSSILLPFSSSSLPSSLLLSFSSSSLSNLAHPIKSLTKNESHFPRYSCTPVSRKWCLRMKCGECTTMKSRIVKERAARRQSLKRFSWTWARESGIVLMRVMMSCSVGIMWRVT